MHLGGAHEGPTYGRPRLRFRLTLGLDGHGGGVLHCANGSSVRGVNASHQFAMCCASPVASLRCAEA
jgi:hypothetical protein